MSICYRKGGGCGPYEMLSCGECPASKPSYAEKEKQGMTVYPSRSDHKHRHDSNADRIRAMSDKELAYFLNNVESDGRVYGPQGKTYWLDWLRQEVEDK